MTHYEHLIYEQRGPVTIITINRPERMNAIGPQTHRELDRSLIAPRGTIEQDN
jgi:enoyl-CoA hydratase